MNLPRLSDEELPALLPCPFDGAPAERGYTNGSWGYYPGKCWVKCTKCGASSPGFADEEYSPKKGTYSIRAWAEAQAAEWWNRRATPVPASQGDEEVLRDAERYRKLRRALSDRSSNGKSHWICSIAEGQPEELDAAVDALATPVTTKEAAG